MSHHELEPGETCTVCGHRKPKKRTATSPTTKVVSIGRLPVERQEALSDALKILAEYTGAVNHSYPAGSLLEALVALGAAQREEIKAYFDKEAT